MDETMADEKIKTAVRQAYGDIARRFVGAPAPVEKSARSSCCGPSQAAVEDCTEPVERSSCCGSSEEAAECIGNAGRLYPVEELGNLPDSVTGASLGCGNPTAIAELQPGEVVLDLGSGGGIDCFLAAKRVGATGRVIGLDMTPDMIKLAQRNAKKIGATNVEFRYGEMEDIPLPDESVDVIISNCVINLSPDKDAVFREAYRVLRPGGRMSVSDMVINGDLPPAIRSRLDAWAGCLAGALDEAIYLDKIRAAGFAEIKVVFRDYASPDMITEEEAQVLLVKSDGQVTQGKDAQALLAEDGLSLKELAHQVASVKIRARKPH